VGASQLHPSRQVRWPPKPYTPIEIGISTTSADATRLTLARLALGVEAQRLAVDEKKGRLMDITAANHRVDEVAAGMRDAVLNWPARVSGQIAAEIGRDPHLVQTILQEQMNALLLEVADRLDPNASSEQDTPA
ncbi:MAG: hypothetical protein O9325_06790, partial [Roseomonas sp.]|nr:hypothetical protein [Roseomonas sp.]